MGQLLLAFGFVTLLLTKQCNAQIRDTIQECTDDAFQEGVIECIANKFEGLLPFQQSHRTEEHFSSGEPSFKFHEPKDNVIRYNFIMPSVSKRMTKSHHKMLDRLYDIGKAFINKELEVLAIEKLKHINFQDMIYEYIVEIMHHIAPLVSKHASQFLTFADPSSVNMEDPCATICSIPNTLCNTCQQFSSVLPGVVSCLREFKPEDFEDNLKWIKCFYNCEDLIPIGSCMTEHFSQCGQWSIMSDLIIRGFADYTGLSDTCIINVRTPDNLTLSEGGEPTMVEFYSYMPPGALCVDFKGLSDPLGMFRALASVLGLLLGNSPECSVQIHMSMQNFWNDLLPHRNIPDMGRPKCHDESAIRQAVIGQHEYANGINTCVINITMENWNSTHSVPIWPSVDLKEDGDVNTTFTLKVVVDNAVIYNNKIPIFIEDKDPGQRVSLCQSTGDPHLITFDGHYYNNLYDGHFYLYRNRELPYEIQVVYQRCMAGGNASCTCAVSVKSGDDVFSVSKCRDTASTETDPILKTVLYVNDDLTPGTRVFVKDHGTRFEVILPTGAKADIVVNNGFLNVYFTPSTYDLTKTEGLCGVFDGDVANDLTLPDGSIYPGPGTGPREQPRDFSKAWRVDESERILTGAISEPSVVSGAPFCKCHQLLLTRVQCTCGGGELLETCDINLDGEIVSNLTALIRRSTKSLQKALDINMDDIDLDEGFEPPEINFDDNDIWNETFANQMCESFIKDDAFVTTCDNRAMAEHLEQATWHCVDDIAITDSDSWKWSALESMKKSCVSGYLREIDLSNDTFATINDLCTNNCNGQGTCNKGQCACNPGYTGGDCSLPSDQQPVVVMDSSSKCDRRHEDCRFATVYGRHMPTDNSLTCRVQEAWIDRNEGTFSSDGEETEVEIMYISPYQVVCFLPTSHSYRVTLEHAGSPLSVTHSSPQPYTSSFIFMAYDSACYTCDINTQSCQEINSRDHCIIEEVCYASGEVNPEEQCQYCNSTQHTQQWAWFTDEVCDEKKEAQIEEDEKAERDLIIRISVACILTVLIILFTVILFLRSKKKGKNYDEEDLDEFDSTDNPEKKTTETKATEGVSNPSFEHEEKQKQEEPEEPLRSPRIKAVQNLDTAPSKPPDSPKDQQFLAAKQAALEGRKHRERVPSTSSTMSNRSLGLGGGGSVAFAQYQTLGSDGTPKNSSLDKGIGAHGTPPISRKNIHSGISVTTWF